MSRNLLATGSVTLRMGTRAWELREGQVFRIGRHEANDLVLRSKKVSRFHAQISWQAERPVVQDLRSVNGTTLDGILVDRARPLRSGQVLRILDLELRVEVHEAEEPPALLADSPEVVTLFTEFGAPEIRGEFRDQVQLHRLLMDLEATRRTGTLALRLGPFEASITYCLGRVVTAAFAGRQGIEALTGLLHASSGHYCFGSSLEPTEGALQLSVQQLIREGDWGATHRYHRSQVA